MKKKKNILIIALLGVLVLIGGTMAYHTSKGFFVNLFHLGVYKTEASEYFSSPNNWQPCEEIPKLVVIKNTGDVNVTARVSYEEFWKGANSTSADHVTELPLKNGNNESIAQINFDYVDDWLDGGDGWYYYRYTLAPGEWTTSFIKSVTLNCGMNFAGDNVCSDVDGKTVCTKPDNPYDGSKYHLYVTTQTLQADKSKEEWDYEAEKDKRLYSIIAEQSQGVDEKNNITFISSTKSGVYTLAAHQADPRPVHYFRGDVKNNYVLFGDYCWRIVRTTNTGGVKMIYDGAPIDGVCSEVGSNTIVSNTPFNSSSNSPAYVGYMYGAAYQITGTSFSAGTVYANSIRYENGRYVLVDTKTVTNWSSDYEEFAAKYRYTCGSSSTSCSTVRHLVHAVGTAAFAISFSGGKTIDTVKREMFANDNNSKIKTTVDNWYNAHMTSYTNDLEDTVFCNDRSFFSGPLSASDNYIIAEQVSYRPSYFAAFGRNKYVSGNKRTPSVECGSREDSFTVSAEKGNGKLTYPVGLLTADEATLAGALLDSVSTNYLRTGYDMWTMSPFIVYNNYVDGFSVFTTGFLGNYNITDSRGVRPVISLKADAIVSGGTGAAGDPYTVIWK